MAVTIKDVAAAAGVSPSTVSRTCKDSPSISRDTKERVRRVMAQLGYQPNLETEPVRHFPRPSVLFCRLLSGTSTKMRSIWRLSAASDSFATSGSM